MDLPGKEGHVKINNAEMKTWNMSVAFVQLQLKKGDK